jgi:hypothetical protein
MDQDFGGDHGDMARAHYGTTRQDAIHDASNDMDLLFRQKCDLVQGLLAVVSALEDIGLDNSHAHQLARQALRGVGE